MTNGVIFNYIPGSGITAPGQFFEVNSGGQYQPVTRLVLQGFASAAGLIAANTPTPVASQNDADRLAGPGSMLREMYRLAAANAPAQPIWIEAVADPGTPKAQWTLTVATLPAPGQGTLNISGRTIQIAVSGTDTTATVAASLTAAINAYYDTLTNAMLPVVAVQGTAANVNVVTLTALHAGAIMNDLSIYNSPAASNVLGATGVLTIAQPVLGTGTPTVSSALAALGDDPADFVVSPFVDFDLAGRRDGDLQRYVGPLVLGSPELRPLLDGCDRYILGPDHDGVGAERSSYHPHRPLSRQRLAVLGMGLRPRRAEFSWLSDVTTGNVSRNQTGRVVQGVQGPRDRSGLWGYSARNTLLNSGISTSTIDSSGNVAIDKTVTTYRVGTSGQPDTVFRDIQAIYQAAGGISYIRAVLAVQCGQRAFAASNPGNLAAIVTPSDIKATFVQAYTTLVDQGVFQNIDGFARNIVVQANATNPARCDVLAPIERVNPLDILAVNATFYQKYPDGF